MPRIPEDVRRLAAAYHVLMAERDEEGGLVDEDRVKAEAQAILDYEGEEGPEEGAAEPVEESAVSHGDMPATQGTQEFPPIHQEAE